MEAMRQVEIEQFNRSQSEKIISIKQERLKRENAKAVARRQIKSLVVAFVLVAFFALTFGTIIYRNALVNEAKYDIFNLKAEIKSLNAQVEELGAAIENQTELSYVEQVAKESLNMQYPTKSQIVYIDGTQTFALSESAQETASVSDTAEEAPEAPSLVIRARDFITALFKRY
jgi:cell division protein FtsB